jgi:branched-chain amino acid transport system substrate-binding protein
MKRIIVTIIAILMVVSLFTACGGQKSADTIKFGINLELSGGAASYGEETLKGMEMAIEEINAAGGVDGKKIEIVKYDNKSEAAEATTLATKLMTQDKVLVVLGPATTGAFKAEIPVAIQNKIPVITGSATADDVTVDASGVKEYAFRICFNDSYQGTAMAKFASSNLSKTKAIVLKDSSSDYGMGLAESFKVAFTGSGGSIVAEEAFVAGDTDFNAILTKIKPLDFDMLFISGYYDEAGLIIKQARGLGIDVPILGCDGFDSPKLVELSGADAANDIYFSTHYSSLDQDQTVQDFIKSFKEKYNADPNAFNALGYDTAKFACDGISRASELTGAALKDALAATKDFSGVTGSFSVDENHNTVKVLVVVELQNGMPVSSTRVGA